MQNKQLIHSLKPKSLVNNNNEATQEEKDVALAKIDEAQNKLKLPQMLQLQIML